MDAKSSLDAAKKAAKYSKYGYSKQHRLRRGGEFRRVARCGTKVEGELTVSQLFFGQASGPKLGITASRKYGKAHERNRFKRLVREAFRRLIPSLPSSLEINVRPRQMAKEATMDDIYRELKCAAKSGAEKSGRDARGAPAHPRRGGER